MALNTDIINRASYLPNRIDYLRFNKFKSYRLLPYADGLPQEAKDLLAEIKTNLGRAILFNEPLPGCSIWLNNLSHYIKIYGFVFSKEEHILFIKLLYELVTGTEIPSETTVIALYVLIRLLKKKKLISPSELELPWRPLYNIAARMAENEDVLRKMYRYPIDYDEGLEMLILCAKTYFPVSATQEILDELKPNLLCFVRGMTLAPKMEVLKCFLPVQLPPEHHSIGHELWFEEFMQLRVLCQNGIKSNDDFIEVMAELASNNIGYINWEPHIPLMFTRLIRSLRLPVSYNKLQVHKPDDVDESSMALWIVSVLGHNSSAQMHLEKFLRTIETYFQPANNGSWVVKLKRILMNLSHHFITRLYKERYAEPTWETPVPDEYKLTESDVDAFVKCMLPVTMVAAFNKTSLLDATQTLQNIAIIRPNLVVPYVLDRVASTPDALKAESHKLYATLNIMQAIARPLARGSRIENSEYCFAEGPTHIISLLSLVLPSIDPNTPDKCFLTIQLISICACLIPIVDTSKPITEISEEERTDYDIVSGFEEFVLQFLDKIFYFIDNSALEFVRLENSAGGVKSKLEKFAEVVLYHVCRVLLTQVNENILENALYKLRTYILERTLEIRVAGQLAVTLCQVFARVDGKRTLQVLLPVLGQTIVAIVNENQDIVNEEHLDPRLLHALLLLSGVVDTTGNNLLPHINSLLLILDHVVKLKSMEGNNLTCKLLSAIFRSLCTMMPYEFTTTVDMKYWGQVLSIDDIKVKWYKPGKEEMVVINQLFREYLMPQLQKLEAYCQDSTTLTRDELLASINIMRSVIEGCDPLLPVWEGKPLNLMESSIENTAFKPTLGIEEEIRMPDGGHVKQYIQSLASRLHDVILENVEADTKCLVSLTNVWCSLFSECDYIEFARMRHKNVENFQKRMKNMLTREKGVMACFVLQHAEGQQIMRLCSRVKPLNETHKEIILKFVSLITRRSAASLGANIKGILVMIFQQLPYSWKIVVPKLCDLLKLDPETDEDAYEGGLSILLSLIVHQVVAKDDWSTMRSLLSAMVNSKPSEKLSIIRLKDKIVGHIASELATVPIKHEIPNSCFELAAALMGTDPQLSLLKPDEKSCRERFVVTQQLNENNLASYNGLINDLLNVLLTENLHWRRSLMAIDFIEYMVHPEQIYSPQVVRYSLGTLIHESVNERQVALRVVINILEQQKRKHPKITIDPPSIGNNVPPEERLVKNMLGPRPDNNWLQYNSKTRPLTAEQWDEPRFVHQPHVGYFVWPKKIEIYAPSSQQPSFDPNRDMTDQEKEIEAFFNDEQNIEKLIKYYGLEMKKDLNKFSISRRQLFKNLFRNHGIVFLKHFLPHLEKLVMDKQESTHRCAAELICGIIRGSKHWPFDMVREMWDSLLPIVRLALAKMTPETIGYWVRCFSDAQVNRNPNRHHWLLECLMEEIRVNELETSFNECGRLLILQAVLGIYAWRVLELLQRLLKHIEDRLFANPFENVRERLSTCLVIVFNSSMTNIHTASNPLMPRVQEFIDKIIPKLQPLVNEKAAKISNNVEVVHASVGSNEVNGLSSPGMNEEEKEKAIRLLKTVCKWVVHMSSVWYGLPPELYQVFPIIYQMENYEADDEVRKLCRTALTIYTQAFTLPSSMPIAIEAMDKMSRHASWWTRYSSLEFIQAWVFYNMGIFLSNPSWVEFVEATVLRLLEDDRVEVRKHAGKVLSGLVHCGFIPNHERLLDEFKKKVKTKLYKKGRSKDDGQNSLNTDALRIRHAAITGLCAFVQAHPYDIPKYVPPIFEYLICHMNDPQPIPMTIKKTLDDFKRTHEGWKRVKEYMQHFTEEQITALQDLTMPPSHYA